MTVFVDSEAYHHEADGLNPTPLPADPWADERNAMSTDLRPSPTADVLIEVLDERARQDAKWGVQNHPDGTGPDRQFIDLDTLDGDEDFRRDGFITHQGAAVLFRDICKANGPAEDNYRDILMEEVAEAFAEMDSTALRTELVQVAAVAVAWVEAIDRRAAVTA